MRIAIIGSGWYGCHLALFLLEKGYYVRIFEKNGDFFSGASASNTNRLHLGFHYPRSKQTRVENIRCYNKFISRYENIVYFKDNNIYGVSQVDSYLDWGTYKDILDSSYLKYEEINPQTFGFSNLQGALLCKEAFIDNFKAKLYFSEYLREYTYFNCEVDENYRAKSSIVENINDFDLIVDCTYSSLKKFKQLNFKHELVQLPILEDQSLFPEMSFAIMDGKFQSLSPYSSKIPNLYYLYDVEYSPVFTSNNYDEIYKEYIKLNVKNELLFKKQIFDKASLYYPSFKKRFFCVGMNLAIRTTLLNSDANRSIQYETSGKVIKIFSGKISSIFEAEDFIMEHIKSSKLIIKNI